MSTLLTIFYRIPVLLAIGLLFSGCSSSTVNDNTQTAVGESRTLQTSSSMSSQEKLTMAESLFSQAMLAAMPERNRLLIQSLEFCTAVLDDPQITPNLTAQSRQLCQQTFNQISPQYMNSAEQNIYILLGAKHLLLNQQPTQALNLLQLDFNTDQVELWSRYHALHAEALYQTSQAAEAVRELMIRQDLLTDPMAIEKNQLLIWKYLSSIPDDQLQQLIRSETATRGNIFLGWLTLSELFRRGHDTPTFNQEVSLWLQDNPAHPADQEFIQQIIAARENAMFKPAQIAVLLPMQGKLAKPAKAIIDGIVASHYSQPISVNLQLRFYDSSNHLKLWDTYQQAVNNGAELIIGPLSKQNLQTLSQSASLPVPTLALNNLEKLNPPAPSGKTEQSAHSGLNSNTDETTLQMKQQSSMGHTQTLHHQRTHNLFQFGLSPESDARRVADKAWKDGHFYAAILTPDSQWGERMHSAFQQRWMELGGVVADSIAYPSSAHDFSDSIKGLLHIEESKERKRLVSQTIGRQVEFTPRRRQDIDMIFMAAFPQQARQIPLQIIYHHGETLPVYATSHIVASYHDVKNNIDLDGVKFADMPWLLGLDTDANSLSSEYQSILFQRLFALGVDSYQLAPYMRYLSENPSESINGETGALSILTGHTVNRSLPWVTFRQGIIQPL